MIPAAFEYQRASSVAEAVALLAEHGEGAKLLAGGHSLLPLMKLRFAAPSVLIDVGGLRDLSYVREAGDQIAIGALTCHRVLETDEVVAQHLPLFGKVAEEIGDPQVRHRGTIGGSLAHADPASDLPAAILALDGTLIATGPEGSREIHASEFFVGFFESALTPGEMLTEIRVPKQNGAGWSFQKFNRRAIDWAIVGVACVTGAKTRVALVNMASTPMRATAVEEALASGSSVAEAAQLADAKTEPPSDLNASQDYRKHLARVLVRRALEEATSAR